MTAAASPAERRIYAYGELSAACDGVETLLVGSGSNLLWQVQDARGLLGHIPRLDRASVARMASALSDSGLTLHVRDRRGPLLELGAVRRSAIGRLVFGTARARPRRLGRWPALAVSYRRSKRRQ